MSSERSTAARAKSFLSKPVSEQARIVSRYSRRGLRRAIKRGAGKVFPGLTIPQRIEGGAWWLASNDWVGDAIYAGVFESYERRFVWEFLQPGMVMIDIGAHHGLYSVIAAKKVGPEGRVISFEPSPRERDRLRRHIRMNRLEQVHVEQVALGKEPGEAILYLPTKRNSGFNSMRVPETLKDEVHSEVVRVETLDDYVDRHGIERIDLMKLDVEGAELDVLTGAGRTLRRVGARPAILCEVEDERAEPWGYRAVEVVRLVEGLGYTWFLPRPGGLLEKFATAREMFDHNLVALPAERIHGTERLLPG